MMHLKKVEKWKESLSNLDVSHTKMKPVHYTVSYMPLDKTMVDVTSTRGGLQLTVLF